MEFSLNEQKINMIKQGLSHINKELIDRKAALGNPKINKDPDPIVTEHLDELVHTCGDLYLIFCNLNEMLKDSATVKLQTIK